MLEATNAAIGTDGFLYRKIALSLERSIAQGEYRLGGKLPSLRRLSRLHDCSVSVVMQAYGELERKGLVESVEKSGFFALVPKSVPLPSPETEILDTKPVPAKPSRMLARVLDASLDPEMVSFGAGIPDRSITSEAAMKRRIAGVLREDPGLLSRYSPVRGSRALRGELARLMARRGVPTNPEAIVVTNACTEALSLAFRAAFKPGDVVAVESPVYYGAISLFEELGLRVTAIPTNPRDGMDLGEVERLAREGRIQGCLACGIFQNPLGFCMPDDAKRRLARIAAEFGIWVVEDDIYHDAGFDAGERFPIKAFDESGRVIYCSSLSKTVSPGIRLGWCLAGSLGGRVEELKCAHTMGGPLFVQEAAAGFLREDYQKSLPRFRQSLKGQNLELASLVRESFPEGTRVSRPEGGFFLWLELPGRVSAERLFERALKEGICVTPGTVFDSSPRYGNCLRLSSGAPMTQAHRTALGRIAEIVREGV